MIRSQLLHMWESTLRTLPHLGIALVVLVSFQFLSRIISSAVLRTGGHIHHNPYLANIFARLVHAMQGRHDTFAEPGRCEPRGKWQAGAMSLDHARTSGSGPGDRRTGGLINHPPSTIKETPMNTVSPVHHFSRLMTIAGLTLGSAAMAFSATAPAFTESKIYFELNDTAHDLGIHSAIDGGPYVALAMTDTRRRPMLNINASGRLAKQGLTQLFFESAEPNFTEFGVAAFLARFPEGTYRLSARTKTNRMMRTSVELSHVMPDRVRNVSVAGVVYTSDSEVPVVSAPVLIDWDPVTTSHPTVGKTGPMEIAKYQYFVQVGDYKLGVDLPPTVTQFQVPAELIALGSDFKLEIIATSATDNNTAVELLFRVENVTAISMVSGR